MGADRKTSTRPPELTADQLRQRIDAVEESYEFFLAYAAQGASSDRESPTGGQLRDFLSKTDAAVTGLADGFRALINSEALSPREHYGSMIDVLERDAHSAQAAVRMVMAQPAISSQLIDNLNASIHLRALLTDLFLLDEVLKSRLSVKS